MLKGQNQSEQSLMFCFSCGSMVLNHWLQHVLPLSEILWFCFGDTLPDASMLSSGYSGHFSASFR